MKHSNFYELVQKCKARELKELKAALKAWGGTFNFQEQEGYGQPIIAVNMNGFDPEPCDVYVESLELDEQDHITIHCSMKQWGHEVDIDVDDIFAGELEYIIDCIPETDTVKDVSIPFAED